MLWHGDASYLVKYHSDWGRLFVNELRDVHVDMVVLQESLGCTQEERETYLCDVLHPWLDELHGVHEEHLFGRLHLKTEIWKDRACWLYKTGRAASDSVYMLLTGQPDQWWGDNCRWLHICCTALREKTQQRVKRKQPETFCEHGIKQKTGDAGE